MGRSSLRGRGGPLGSAVLSFILRSVAVGGWGRHGRGNTGVQGWGYRVALLWSCGRVGVCVLARLCTVCVVATVSVVWSGERGGVGLRLGVSWGRTGEGV